MVTGNVAKRSGSARRESARAGRATWRASGLLALILTLLAACSPSAETDSSTPTDTGTQTNAPTDSGPEPSPVPEQPTSEAEPSPVPELSPSPVPATSSCVETPQTWRTDLSQTGNRIAAGTVDFAAAPVSIALPDVAEWVLPWGTTGDWYVVLADGSARVVSPDGSIESAPAPLNGEPPEISIGSDGTPVVGSAWADHGMFTNPLPDTRVVTSGDLAAALVDPTDRYAHGVLGDVLEAEAVEILDRCTDERTRIEISAPSVIEGISPLFADMDGDGVPEILITTSNEMVGARLEAWSVEGELIARSDVIDRGRRWRNQLGVGPTSPEGGIEIIDVRVPHLTGLVEFFRLSEDRLVRSAKLPDFTSHVLGSRNLDMGVLVDTTGDSRPEVLVFSRDRQQLAAITRTADGAEVTTAQPLDGQGVTNISVHVVGTSASLAVGTTNAVLHVWQN